MALDPAFFALPAAGVAAAVLAVWATTRQRVDRIDAKAARAAIAADLLLDPPAEAYVDAAQRCAFAPVADDAVAIAIMAGDRIAVRLLRANDVAISRTDSSAADRVTFEIVTRDFDKKSFVADMGRDHADRLCAILAPPLAHEGQRA